MVGFAPFALCVRVGVYRLTGCNSKTSVFFIIFLMLVLNGERLLNFPLFPGLMFLEPMSKDTQYIGVRELCNYGI